MEQLVHRQSLVIVYERTMAMIQSWHYILKNRSIHQMNHWNDNSPTWYCNVPMDHPHREKIRWPRPMVTYHRVQPLPTMVDQCWWAPQPNQVQIVHLVHLQVKICLFILVRYHWMETKVEADRWRQHPLHVIIPLPIIIIWRIIISYAPTRWQPDMAQLNRSIPILNAFNNVRWCIELHHERHIQWERWWHHCFRQPVHRTHHHKMHYINRYEQKMAPWWMPRLA